MKPLTFSYILLSGLALIFSSEANQAIADMTLKDYRDFRFAPSAREKAISQLYLEATYMGIQTTAVRYHRDGYPMSYCVPPDQLLTIEDLYELIDQELAELPETRSDEYLEDDPISIVLLNALQETYPCDTQLDYIQTDLAAALAEPEQVFACRPFFEVQLLFATNDESKEVLAAGRDWFVRLERRIEDEIRAGAKIGGISKLRQHGLDTGAFVAKSRSEGTNLQELDTLTDLCVILLDRTGYSF